ncbi:MAG: D-alanyl-D-alanine carboxypeptidase/D-alanyl-D-alanine endopeptidase, partial [Angustibacter sp.]
RRPGATPPDVPQPRTSHRRKLLAVVGVVLVASGYLGADVADVAPGFLTTSTVGTAGGPQPRSARADAPQRVLAELSADAPIPDRRRLAVQLDGVLSRSALGPAVSASVVDGTSGAVLYSRAAQSGREAASTAKLLTGAAVLLTVGPDTRLATSVVRGPAPDQIILVGGGDTLLATGSGNPAAVAGHAGLRDLAAQTARELRGQGLRRVKLSFDDSFFDRPDVSPRWLPDDIRAGLTGRVTALGLADDRAVPGAPGPRDPSASAARAFGQALARQGISVTGAIGRTRAPAGAAQLGRVASAPVAQIMGLALADSDNALADAMARLTARALGRPTTSDDAAIAVLDQIRSLGIDTSGVRLVDGSGLSRGSFVPARVLTDILTLTAGDRHPRLRSLITELPVAGLTGTLADRFSERPARSAAGVVRAKTGTLTGVSGLAGTTVDADGRLLVFAVLADRVPDSGRDAARAALDEVAAVLASCGCRVGAPPASTDPARQSPAAAAGRSPAEPGP